AEARLKKPHPREEPNAGKVTFVANERVYLDKGKADGVVAGETLELSHGRFKLPCKVEAVTSRFATCSAPNAQVGDRFVVRAPPPAPPPPTLPALPSKRELLSRLSAVHAAAIEQVPFEGEGPAIF